MTPPSRVARLLWGRLSDEREETARQVAEIQAKMPFAEDQVCRAQRCMDALDTLAAVSATSLRSDRSRPVGVETLPGLHQRG